MKVAFLDKEKGAPIYLQLKSILKESISEEFQPGDKFYSEAQIAEAYSISTMTVNKVLSELVKENLLHRIQGKGTFVSERTRIKTGNIGFVISCAEESRTQLKFHQTIEPQKLSMFYAECERYKYDVHLFMESTFINRKSAVSQALEKVDGLILSDAIDIDVIRALYHKKPTVLLDYYVENENFDFVIADNVKGAYQSVEYLIKCGHKRIGCIHGPIYSPSFRERISGYKQALSDYGLPFDEDLLMRGGAFVEDGYRAMGYLMDYKKPPTAVFASNDIMAIGAMKRIKEAGLKVPDDISVVGFDNIEAAEFVDPALTTIDTNAAQMLHEAMDLLIKKISGQPYSLKRVIVPVALVKRNSVKVLK